MNAITNNKYVQLVTVVLVVITALILWNSPPPKIDNNLDSTLETNTMYNREQMNMNTKKRKTVGLALGGGGARGIAHIGVIKSLVENNIPIDYIAGTSAGAMVGSLYADTLDTNQIEHILHSNAWYDYVSLLDPVIKRGAIKGEKIEKFIGENLNSKSFAELQLPFVAVTTDINTGDTVTLSKGNLAKAVRASASIPFIFQPVKYGDKLLVDALLTEPLPVEMVRAMGADIVIAVDLNGYHFSGTDSDDKKFGLYDFSKRSFDIMQRRLATYAKMQADIVVIPDTSSVHWYQVVGNGSLIKAGEDAMNEQIKQVKKMLGK